MVGWGVWVCSGGVIERRHDMICIMLCVVKSAELFAAAADNRKTTTVSAQVIRDVDAPTDRVDPAFT